MATSNAAANNTDRDRINLCAVPENAIITMQCEERLDDLLQTCQRYMRSCLTMDGDMKKDDLKTWFLIHNVENEIEDFYENVFMNVFWDMSTANLREFYGTRQPSMYAWAKIMDESGMKYLAITLEAFLYFLNNQLEIAARNYAEWKGLC